MKQVNIYEREIIDKGTNLEFIYAGTTNKDIDIDNIKELVHNFVLKKSCTHNMIKNILMLKTILRDVDETNFTLSYVDNNTYESIKYVDKKLYTYNKNFQNNEENELLRKKYEFSYNAFDTKKVKYDDQYSDIRTMSKNLNDLLENVEYFEKLRPFTLSEEAKYVIEIYKIFYEENPDFTDSNILKKIQSMMFILSQYGISIPDYSNFLLQGKNEVPRSLDLSELIYRLYAFGKIEGSEELIKISNEAKESIKVIRDAINKINGMDELDSINKNIYNNRYTLSHKPDYWTMEGYLNTFSSDVAKSLRLVNNIECELYKL